METSADTLGLTLFISWLPAKNVDISCYHHQLNSPPPMQSSVMSVITTIATNCTKKHARDQKI